MGKVQIIELFHGKREHAFLWLDFINHEDESALLKLVEAYRCFVPPVVNWIIRRKIRYNDSEITLYSQDREDLLNHLYLKLIEVIKFYDIDKRIPLEAWVTTALRGYANDYVKKLESQWNRECQFITPDGDGFKAFEDQETNVEKQVLDSVELEEKLAAIRNALNKAPDSYRRIIDVFYLQNRGIEGLIEDFKFDRRRAAVHRYNAVKKLQELVKQDNANASAVNS